MAVRSNYIKNLMETKKTLDAQYQEVIAESMKNIIGDNAKDEVRRLLKEADDEDSYTEEEVDDNAATTEKDDEITDITTDTEDGESEETTDIETEVSDDLGDDVVDVDGGEEGNGEDTDDDLWNDLEKCKSADGEYDCRGMQDGNLLKVLKAMGPEDGIRVMSNGDGTVAIEVDGDLINGEEEYILDLDEINGTDDTVEESVKKECNENEVDLGYTTKYQGRTALTTDNNNEPADSKTTYSMDDGVPTGTERPYGTVGDGKPFEGKVNEDEKEFEIELDDEETVNEGGHTITQNNSHVRGANKTITHTTRDNFAPREGSKEGEVVKPTTENPYESISLDFKRKMNRLYEENKQMKAIIPELNKKLVESMVINANMGYVVRLINENATTQDEKREISTRFAKVTTLEEGKKLYESISEELKKTSNNVNVNGIINGQLAEGKQSKQTLVETTMYKSEKVNEALDFMKRLDLVK